MIKYVFEMDDLFDDLPGRLVDGYSSDGISFVDVENPSDLQLLNFTNAVSSGNCVIRLRKSIISGTARGFLQKSFSGPFQFPLLWTNWFPFSRIGLVHPFFLFVRK